MGEEGDTAPADDGKDPVTKALGKKGDRRPHRNMTPERRAKIAKVTAKKRWDSKN